MESKVKHKKSFNSYGSTVLSRIFEKLYKEYKYMIYKGEVQKLSDIKLGLDSLMSLKSEGNLFKSEKKARFELIKRKI